ncbi:MAG: hypothetical protein HZB79_02050 [Deltaproteobacteria bacterium]|nr:hypothetical protein [Deltaproteobacteria bacterium]
MDVSDWTNIKAIASGWYHTVGLKEDGTVVVGGYFTEKVSDWTNIKAIAAGWTHIVGLKEDGTVVAVGYNRDGQLDVSGWTNIKAIAAGVYHTLGLKEDGTVVAVGYNYFGQLNVLDWTNIRQPSCIIEYTALPEFISTLPGISPQVLTSLVSKAKSAIASFENWNTGAAINKLNALLNEITAQSGKKIDADTAATLTKYVQNLIIYIQSNK